MSTKGDDIDSSDETTPISTAVQDIKNLPKTSYTNEDGSPIFLKRKNEDGSLTEWGLNLAQCPPSDDWDITNSYCNTPSGDEDYCADSDYSTSEDED